MDGELGEHYLACQDAMADLYAFSSRVPYGEPLLAIQVLAAPKSRREIFEYSIRSLHAIGFVIRSRLCLPFTARHRFPPPRRRCADPRQPAA